jgi:hypothetical protein
VEAGLTQKFLWRVVLIAVLSVALVMPARASYQTTGKEAAIGIVVAAVAVIEMARRLVLRNHSSIRCHRSAVHNLY